MSSLIVALIEKQNVVHKFTARTTNDSFYEWMRNRISTGGCWII